MKKFISLILCSAMAFSMCAAVIADEVITDENNKEIVTTNNEGAEETPTATPEATPTATPEATPTATPEATPTATPEATPTPIPDAPPVNNDIRRETTVVINGKTLEFGENDVKAFITGDNRTFVPFRRIGEELNAAVAWRSTDNAVFYFRKGQSIMLTIGGNKMETRSFEIGKQFVYTSKAKVEDLDSENPNVKAFLENDSTVVPVRVIAEAFGAEVNYDGTTNVVTIDLADGYAVKWEDKEAAKLIEEWNYEPIEKLKECTLTVKVSGNYPDASATVGDGMTITINDQTQTVVNGVCTFEKMEQGTTYTITVDNIPEGHKWQLDEYNTDTVVIDSEVGEKTVRLQKTEAEKTPAE